MAAELGDEPGVAVPNELVPNQVLRRGGVEGARPG
jgi:hypothetical protein